MGKSATSRVAAAMLALTAGCANRSEERVRRAWRAPVTVQPGAASEAATEGPGAKTGPTAGPTAPVRGWARVDELLERSLDVLTTAPSPQRLGQLAVRWCEVAPVPRETDVGSVSVCYLHPPVRVQGVALTLELTDTGIIAFVAPDLTADKSAEVAAEAQAAIQHHCESPWSSINDAEVQSCKLPGGSTLAVGRLQPRGRDAPWQVSIAVLGAL